MIFVFKNKKESHTVIADNEKEALNNIDPTPYGDWCEEASTERKMLEEMSSEKFEQEVCPACEKRNTCGVNTQYTSWSWKSKNPQVIKRKFVVDELRRAQMRECMGVK